MENKPRRVGWATVPHLQKWRERYGYSQARLAALAGISRATVSSAENGGRIYPSHAEAIAKVFGISLEQMAREPNPEDALVLAPA